MQRDGTGSATRHRLLAPIAGGVVGAVLVLAAPALGHGVQHALFAHNADRVDGLHANALVRVAGDSRGDSQAPLVGDGTILSTTIKAPRAGFLLIEASSDAWNSDTYLFPACFLAVDGRAIDWSVRYLDLYSTSEQVCSTSAMGSVPKGIHPISLQATGADDYTNWGASNLSITFVPFGPTGAPPTASEKSLLSGPPIDLFLRELPERDPSGIRAKPLPGAG